MHYSVSNKYRVKCWDNHCIAFHKESGGTHRVESLPGHILNILLQNPLLTLEELAERVSAVLSEEITASVVETYARRLLAAKIIVINE